MIFDKLCKYVEKNVMWDDELKNLIPLLREARLFEFDELAQNLGQARVSDEELQDFHMPFNCVAVEDPAGLVILLDTIEGQIGTTTPRFFCEITDFGVDPKVYGDLTDPMLEYMESMQNRLISSGVDMKLSDIISITIGKINSLVNHPRPENQHGFAADVSVGWQAVLSDGLCTRYPIGENSEYAEPFARNAIVAMEELLYIQSSEFFILEKTPIKIKNKKNLIPRSHQRPRYTVLRPKEIREKMKLTESGSGSKKDPHERRRHMRYLRDDRYRYEDGKELEPKMDPVGRPYFKKTLIPATWIGPSENRVRNHIYKVRLDL